MYRKIVLAYDGSEMGQQALLGCKEIAELAQSELYLIAVVPPAIELASGEGTFSTADYEESERHRFREVLDDGLKRLGALGRSATGEVVVRGHHRGDLRVRRPGGRGPHRGRAQAPRGVGESLVEAIGLEVADRARALQRPHRHHALSRPACRRRRWSDRTYCGRLERKAPGETLLRWQALVTRRRLVKPGSRTARTALRSDLPPLAEPEFTGYRHPRVFASSDLSAAGIARLADIIVHSRTSQIA